MFKRIYLFLGLLVMPLSDHYRSSHLYDQKEGTLCNS